MDNVLAFYLGVAIGYALMYLTRWAYGKGKAARERRVVGRG